MAVEALTSDAFAKVNLTLRITGRLADGYHTLESLVMFALVADQLTLQPGCDLSLSIAGTCPAGLGGENNLILRAARALAEQVAGLRAGHFILNKRLPIAAGIGGGSADAAAALRLLAGLNGLALHDPRLQAAARATGADVPACLLSEPLVMRGIGEILSQRGLPDVPVVLVNPGIDVSTVEVFTALDLPRDDRIRGGDAPDIPNTFGDLIAALKGMPNDLEAPAATLCPDITTVLDTLRQQAGAALCRMSGSGATCFALFRDDDEAKTAAGVIADAHPRWWVAATRLRGSAT